MFYQKLTDIYSTSVDYNKDDETTKNFFAKVQNKLHFAIHGQTAAELIFNRVDSQKDKMGLTSWDNAPDGKILKSDVTIALAVDLNTAGEKLTHKAAGEKYIGFFSLRSHGINPYNGIPYTEQIYIHSKIMIIDD
jgi:hypothetical protein